LPSGPLWACSVWSSPLERTVRLPPPSSRRVEVTVTTGTIKKVVSDRGFGFIAAENGKEYFFHRDGLTSSLDFDRLTGGEKVQFDVEASPKGDRAKNVQSA
jgi:CspA family cold shock protein